MSVKRSRPGVKEVRKDASVGPDYPTERFRNPFDGPGLDYQYGEEGDKTLVSPANTVSGLDIPLRHEYDELWKGK